MPLLDYTDFERQANLTLFDPDGRTLANTIAAAILKWCERYTGLSFTPGAVTEYTDGGANVIWLGTKPITNTPSVALYNSNTGLYDAYTGTTRYNPLTGELWLDFYPCSGWQTVRVTYTAGYTTLPDDLKQALTELLVAKFNDADGGSTALKKVSSGAYSEEYGISTADIPMDVMEVVDSYRAVRVF